MKKLVAIISSVCIGFSALWGAIIAPNDHTKYGPPALYINEAVAREDNVRWEYPPNRAWWGGREWRLPAHLESSLTVSPGSVLELSNKSYWLGIMDIDISFYDAAGLPVLKGDEGNEYREWLDESIPIVPVSYTQTGQPLAPTTPGCYIAYFTIVYESRVWILTGSGWTNNIIMFTVE